MKGKVYKVVRPCKEINGLGPVALKKIQEAKWKGQNLKILRFSLNVTGNY